MLLKAIEEKTFRPLGAAKDEHSDFQLICGTNRDLADPARFRPDLLARIDLWSFRLPGIAERREDIEPNLAYELARFSQRTGRHVSFNKEAHERFLAFALDPANLWPGNFRDLNAMVVRMATLADGGRITAPLVMEEIARARAARPNAVTIGAPMPHADLAALLGDDFATRYDAFDIVQLEYVIGVCQTSATAAEAAKRLFAVSRLAKKTANDTDRLSKYLARFGIKFRDLKSK